MYARDWRAAWSPAMEHFFPGTTPASLFDYTPAELDAKVTQTEKMLKDRT